jgi:hypothetical protein
MPEPDPKDPDTVFERELAEYLKDPEFRKMFFETQLEIARIQYRHDLDRLADS